MRNNLLLILAAVLTCCKTVSVSKDLSGHYFKAGKDYKYSLLLNKDSSFALTQKYLEVYSTCKGKWQYLSTDTILLMCDDEDLSVKLQSGYMTERKKRVILVTKSKVKLGQVTLKRQR
ncbi:hypothetical protein [Longitalea luteola]|uniref:hypothetical protein n=1 Tax=Longitalea luteola TaxID=2812563 RepID=UPI001A96BBC2|nr:hypothetical protein [Longitalea luteola]